jgi:flagellar hook-length control protein FliK
LLPIEMPVQRVDNSFDSNDYRLVESAKADNLQDKGKFSEVFDSASSEFKKMNKNDLDHKVKLAVINKEGNRVDKVVPEVSSKGLLQKSKKLISLRKIGFDVLKGSVKKSLKRERPEDNITQISNKINFESSEQEELSGVVLSDKFIINPEIEDKPAEISVFTNIAMEFSEAGSLKGTDLLKTDSKEKKNSVKKKNNIIDKSKTVKDKISVLDLRKAEHKNSKIRQTDLSIERDAQKFSIAESDQVRVDNADDSKPIIIELTHIKDNFSSESKTLTTASSSSLMKQMEESINSKIVKQSSIILKDGDSGEIKLILRPEKLGSVRIRLSLTDNRIAGQIIVDSLAIKDAFEENLQNLEKAFKENGFDTAALNVSVGGDQSGSEEKDKDIDISKQIELIDENIPTLISDSENLIDLVV